MGRRKRRKKRRVSKVCLESPCLKLPQMHECDSVESSSARTAIHWPGEFLLNFSQGREEQRGNSGGRAGRVQATLGSEPSSMAEPENSRELDSAPSLWRVSV